MRPGGPPGEGFGANDAMSAAVARLAAGPISSSSHPYVARQNRSLYEMIPNANTAVIAGNRAGNPPPPRTSLPRLMKEMVGVNRRGKPVGADTAAASQVSHLRRNVG